MKRQLYVLTILMLAISNTIFGQNFHETIQGIYGGFVPHNTSRVEINKKIVQLDSLFKIVQLDTNKYLPLLREELNRKDNPPYFYWDGAVLLLTTSKASGTEKLFINAVKKTDMYDIDTDIYWHVVRSLSLKGFDISDLALKILDVKIFKAVIYEHAFTIEKDYSLYYLLIPLPPEMYVSKLIERFNTEKNEENKIAILNMLWHSRSCTANNFLTQLCQDETISKNEKSRLNKMKIKNISYAYPNKKYTKNIERQKEIYNFITDYTIIEVDKLTKKLRMYNCL